MMQVENYFSRAEADAGQARLEAAGIPCFIYDLEKSAGRFELWVFDDSQWSDACLLIDNADPPVFNEEDWD